MNTWCSYARNRERQTRSVPDEVEVQDFDGDRLIQLHVCRFQHGPHAARAENSKKRVAFLRNSRNALRTSVSASWWHLAVHVARA
jgi:hypothetical protein